MYIVNSQFLSCCTFNQIITVNSSTNAPITIWFACLQILAISTIPSNGLILFVDELCQVKHFSLFSIDVICELWYWGWSTDWLIDRSIDRSVEFWKCNWSENCFPFKKTLYYHSLRLNQAKILIARPNEPDVPLKQIKNLHLGTLCP